VTGFIKTAAIEFAKYHININAVEPGKISNYISLYKPI
jgi:NAD(P)-dependent dehydrogenase (short-subunit alcohol dehydrogenase family)